MRRISSKVIRPNGLIESRVPPAVRKAVYERDDHTCTDCGTKGTPGRTKGSIQAYHIVPIREGGEHTVDNMITVCYSCRKRRDDQRRKAKPVSRSSFRWRKLKDKK